MSAGSVSSGRGKTRRDDAKETETWGQPFPLGGSLDQLSNHTRQFVMDSESPPYKPRPSMTKLDSMGSSMISIAHFDDSLSDLRDNLERFSQEGTKARMTNKPSKQTRTASVLSSSHKKILIAYYIWLFTATAVFTGLAVSMHMQSKNAVYTTIGQCNNVSGNPYLQCICGQSQVTGDVSEIVDLRFMELNIHFGLERGAIYDTNSCQNPYNVALWWLAMKTESLDAKRLMTLFSLALLYLNLDGTNWNHQTDWMYHEVNECDWGGVTCSYELIADPSTTNVDAGVVVQLVLDNMKLSGSLPSEIGLLTDLETLSLGNNDFCGKLPKEILGLTNLQELSLQGNAFEGTIPDPTIFSHLKVLVLGNNKFSGVLPENSLYKWTGLQELILESNSFSGSLPSSLATLTQLSNLNLAKNTFKGAMPDIFALTDLKWLIVNDNELTGTLNNFFPDRLETLDMSNNMFNGTLPINYGSLSKLSICNLGHNKNLRGNLPSEYGLLYKLNVLGLSSCQLTGIIPSELGNLETISILDLGNNMFKGNMPMEVCKLKMTGFLQELLVNCAVNCTCCPNECDA